MLNTEDTIVAIASASGVAPRGIVRVSGPLAMNLLQTVFRSHQLDRDSPEDVNHSKSPYTLTGEVNAGEKLGMAPCEALVWPTKRSYTQQTALELHTIGSPPLLAEIVTELCRHGARVAGPGEFTMRAFLAGRIDLTQAEAVLGVIDAEGDQSLQVALKQLSGNLATPLHELREEMLGFLAHLEAGLDFVEEDIEFISQEELLAQLGNSQQRILELVEQLATRHTSREAFRVVICGRPNVGKSSLLNALTADQVAIVSEQAGATRDYLTQAVRLGGVDCLLIDTAGVEETPSVGIAATAQNQTNDQVKQADLKLFCLEAEKEPDNWERQQLEALKNEETWTIIVLTKADRSQVATPSVAMMSGGGTSLRAACMLTSSEKGEGIRELREQIAATAQTQQHLDTSVVPATAMRCQTSLNAAASALHRAENAVIAQLGEELVAAEIRAALDELGQVVGAVYTDDILDRIFSRFCIGK